jgi:hypothetical protein
MGAYDSNDAAIASHEHYVVIGVQLAQLPFDRQFFKLAEVPVERQALALRWG